jgi:putative protease
MNNKLRKIELLAPAKNLEIGIEAIKHGADAVYIGAPSFGARAQATNTINDINRLVDFAHQYQAKIYCTVNTILYDNELKDVEAMIHSLYSAGVDAIIVQDMSLLRLDLPPIALHASTQCDIRDAEKALFLQKMGFSQLVLARELTISEINEIANKVNVPIETFCHGALCVSYSGRCQISQAIKNRSGNRGECAQFCRLSYDLEDGDGNIQLRQKHLLSLRDFNAHNRLEQMIDAGVSSFKIEGRLKDMEYVKNVVAYYSQALDKIVDAKENIVRSSIGKTNLTFSPQLEKSFNRSFTHYFLDGRHPDNGSSMASINTPKSQGEFLGKVINVQRNEITLDAAVAVANGDGISFFDRDGNYNGFRINKVIGNKLYLKERCNLSRGDVLYRTFDKAFTDVLSRNSAQRTIDVDFTLWVSGNILCLKAQDESGCAATHSIILENEPQQAMKPQAERQRQVLAKLGDTVFTMRECKINDNVFIPASLLTRLRRETIELLLTSRKISYQRDLRKQEDLTAVFPYDTLGSSDNVANTLAEKVYRDHGVKNIEPAIEQGKLIKNQAVMTTRYCLRRELGACLKDSKTRNNLPPTLMLRNGRTLLKVDCDCKLCEMRISIVKQ